MDWIKNNLFSLLLMAVIIGLLSAAWTFWPRAKPVVGMSVSLPAAKEVRTVEKVIYRPKLVYVYPDKVKAKLNLPAQITKDQTKKVLTTGKLETNDRPYTLSAVLDTTTGNSEVYARPDPLPWIGPGKMGAIGVSYGLRDGKPMGRAYIYHDLLRVKALHAGARAELDQDGQNYIGAYVEYRF